MNLSIFPDVVRLLNKYITKGWQGQFSDGELDLLSSNVGISLLLKLINENIAKIDVNADGPIELSFESKPKDEIIIGLNRTSATTTVSSLIIEETGDTKSTEANLEVNVSTATPLQQLSVYAIILIDIINENLIILAQSLPAKLLSTKIPDTLGAILVLLMNNPALNLHNLDTSRVRSILNNYHEKLIAHLFQSKNLKSTADIIIDLWRHENILPLLIPSWTQFCEIEVSSRQVEKLTSNIVASINSQYSIDNSVEWFTIIKLWLRNVKRDTLYRQFEKMNPSIIPLWVQATSPNKNWLEKSLIKFSTVEGSHQSQLALFTLIIVLIKKFDDAEIDRLSKSPNFLNSISARLDSRNNAMRELGMAVADEVYLRINNKKMFDIDGYNQRKDSWIAEIDNVLSKTGKEISIDEALDKLQRPPLFLTKASPGQTSNEMIFHNPPKFDVNDPEEDPDPTIPKLTPISTPFYLKDLHILLTSSDDHDKQMMALATFIPLIRSKRETPELNFWSQRLWSAILNCDAVLETPETFNTWKLSAMVSILVSDYKMISWVIDSFLKEDWSIPTRIQTLSAIAFAARELSGKGEEDSMIWKGELEKKELPTAKLWIGEYPNEGNQLTSESQLKLELELESESKRVLKPANKLIVDLDEHVRVGTVTRRSARLDREPEVSKDTTFSNKSIPKLFFRLTSILLAVSQHTGFGFKIGSLSYLLNDQYLTTLSIIYECSGFLERSEMNRELSIIIEAALQADCTDGGMRCLRALIRSNGIDDDDAVKEFLTHLDQLGLLPNQS
ncbi:hypothetical protein DAMA08_048860 [Martiniozyma asiatica (nom. inval.)]|nr:hypothetical protein DAMA08_048860 [Martiniozyma asiatica]